MPPECRRRPCSRPCRSACCSISNGVPASLGCPGHPRLNLDTPKPGRAHALTRAHLASVVRNVQAFAARGRTVLMPDLNLTLACWDYDRTRPLIDGRVKPEGIDLDIEVLRPRQAFQRML